MSLDCVGKHPARHGSIVFPQKGVLDFAIAFSNLPQHPADRLVNQVVSVVQQQLGYLQSRFESALLNKEESGDDRYSSLPDIVRSREPLEKADIPGIQVRTDDVLRRSIDG